MSQSEQRKKDNERMRMSGYDENYRYQIIKSGVEGFDKMLEREKNEGVPINKPRAYEEDEVLISDLIYLFLSVSICFIEFGFLSNSWKL